MMRKWDVQRAVDIIIKEKITAAGGCVYPSKQPYPKVLLVTSRILKLIRSCSVPSIALDLLENENFTKQETHLEGMTYGGAPAPPTIPKAVVKLPGGNVSKYVRSFCRHLSPSFYGAHLCFVGYFVV